jgi:hypothetical protein
MSNPRYWEDRSPTRKDFQVKTQELKRWLCLGLFALAAPAAADVGSPVDCGTVECEGIRGLWALGAEEQNFFAETDRYTQNLAELGAFQPAACANGTRAPVPGPGWVSGCNYSYKVSSVTPNPTPTFVVFAQGAAGTPAAGITLQLSTHPTAGLVFWLERNGVRRYVDSAECLPAASFTCDAQMREALWTLKVVQVAQASYFQERDRYSTSFAQIGAMPSGCLDGTRAPVPDASWIGGCRFIYKITLNGTAGYTTTARAVRGHVEHTVVTRTEAGLVNITPSYALSCQ